MRRLLVAVLVVGGCVASASPAAAQGPMALPPAYTTSPWTPPWYAPAPSPAPDPSWDAWDPASAMARATGRAGLGGRRVLETAQRMIEQGVIVRGSCYDWVDAVFHQASGRWHDSFHGSRAHHRYAQVSDLQPGDWVLFEHEGGGTHSAIFVDWADPSARVATMMSYPGQRRDEPGRYGTYALSSAYRIIRMTDDPPDARPARPARPARRPRAHH